VENLLYLEAKAELMQEPYSEASEAFAKKHTKDLMYVKLELCHANINRNKDEFLSSELKQSYKTIIDKPINWEHTSEVIGHVYASEFIKSEAKADVDINTDKIVAEGVIYKYKFPQRAKEIAKRYDRNDLFFSMETYFDKAKCSICEKEFVSEMDYCRHLNSRYSATSEVSRILLGNLFSGVGCVENPADDAKGLAIASRNKSVQTLMEFFGDRFTLGDYFEFLTKIRG